MQCIASVAFLYFASLSPIITFGGLLGDATENRLAALESLLAGCICGLIYSLFSGQPLALLNATGPVLVFETILYSVCKLVPFVQNSISWNHPSINELTHWNNNYCQSRKKSKRIDAYWYFKNLVIIQISSLYSMWFKNSPVTIIYRSNGFDYLSVRLWVGIWIGVFLIVMCAFELSAWVSYITPFTEENFALLIASIYIYKVMMNNFVARSSGMRRKQYQLSSLSLSSKLQMIHA